MVSSAIDSYGPSICNRGFKGLLKSHNARRTCRVCDAALVWPLPAELRGERLLPCAVGVGWSECRCSVGLGAPTSDCRRATATLSDEWPSTEWLAGCGEEGEGGSWGGRVLLMPIRSYGCRMLLMIRAVGRRGFSIGCVRLFGLPLLREGEGEGSIG